MSFANANRITRREEGGFSNHPDDNGGATQWGVTQAVYDAYRKNKRLPIQPVSKIVETEADEIYFLQYWRAAGADRVDQISPAIALELYDFAVNSGPGRAVRYLQQTLGTLADQSIGEIDMAAIKEIVDAPGAESAFVKEYMNARRAFGRGLTSKNGYPTFGKGWEIRWTRVESQALRMVKGAPASPKPLIPINDDPDAQAIANGKAIPEQSSTTSFDIGAGVMQAGNAVAMGTQAVGAARDARDLSEMLISVGPWVLLAVVIAGAGYYFWQLHRQKIKDTLL